VGRHRPNLIGLVMEAQGLAERDIPQYVAPDGTAKATFTRVPTLDEVPYPVRMSRTSSSSSTRVK
jgi:hypothetical protein